MLVIYLCNINLAANITTVSWMSAIKKTARMMTGHVAKGCLMISLDNEMHMSIVDVIQIRE